MEDLSFKAKTIAPAGRNKYGNYMSSGNITKSVVTTTYAGNGTTTTIGDTGGTEDIDNTSFYCVLSQTNIVFDANDLADGASADTIAVAYRGYDKAPVYITDMEAVELITSGTGNEVHIAELIPPENYGINGIESGLSVEVLSGTNGTSAATIRVYADSTLLPNKGTLYIPAIIYKRSTAVPQPEDLYDWYDSVYNVTSAGTIPTNDTELVWLELGWAKNSTATGNYQMDLSNEKAGVNVSAITQSGDILFPTSIATLECTASTHMGTELVTGLTYTKDIHPRYHSRGVEIVNSDGVGYLTFTSAGTDSFNFEGPTLPINIIASNGSGFSIAKTFTVEKNYPGSEGQAAVTKWIVTSVSDAKYNPNTGDKAPDYVTAYVMKQVGGDEPFVDSAETIYYWYASTPPARPSDATPLPSQGAEVIPEEAYIVFALRNSQDVFYEKETVLILWDGTNGASGATGASGAPGTNGTDGQSAWYLTMSNDNASINADENGNIYPTSVNPSSCKLKMYYGSNRMYDATYSMSANTGYTGVTLSTSNDGVGTISFSQGTGSQHTGRFNFEGDVLELTVSGTSSGEVRDVKVMTIIKSRAGAAGESGAPGTDAVTYWLEPSYTEIIYDPNTRTRTPSKITCEKRKQVGQKAPTTATDVTIKYQWQSTGGTFSQAEDFPSTGLDITTGNCVNNRRLRLLLMWSGATTASTDDVQYDMEDIDIIKNGLDGTAQDGRTGAAIRGPYNFADVSASTRCWCAGESSSTCSDCDKWIDVIYKDGTYYYCNETYYGKLTPWSTQQSHWTEGESFDFVAANLILASGASINFLTNNELYLRDENGNITGGAKGGSGTTFWAGAENPADAPFRVDVSGNVFAQMGTFAGFVQMPYKNVLTLPYTTVNSAAHISAGTNAYIISLPQPMGMPIGTRYLYLLPPSSGLNGFMYDIVIQGPVSQYCRWSDLIIKVEDNSTIACYAYPEARYSDEWAFNCGRITIVCLPYVTPTSTTTIRTDYRWVITSATGTMSRKETYNGSTRTEYISSILGTSYESSNSMIYNLMTYSGTKPSADPDIYISNPNNIMFIKK